MITTKEAQKLCARMIAYLIGGKEDAVQLRKDYAAAVEDEGAKLARTR